MNYFDFTKSVKICGAGFQKLPLAYGDKFIYLDEDGSNVIKDILLKGKPASLCRFSAVEYETVRQFFKFRDDKKRKFIDRQRFAMKNNAGFFPTDDYNMTKFACELLKVTKNMDVLGCWGRKLEPIICGQYLDDNATVVSLSAFDSLCYKNPWTELLKGRKVLVIHPFVSTIQKQYLKREYLFDNPKILPEFHLMTYKPVQTSANATTEFNTWFDALEFMKNEIRNLDFDVALIGAGAYGLFLADFCKEIGKIGIHLGGNTQILFGIKGARWDNHNFYNEHWVRPSAEEIPSGFKNVEGGCYW